MELPSFGRSAPHRPPGNSERRWFPLLPRKAITIQSNQQIRNKWAVLDSISGLVSRWGVFPLSSSSFFLQILQSSGGNPAKRGAYGQRMTKGHSLRNFMELHGTSNTHTHTLLFTFTLAATTPSSVSQFIESVPLVKWTWPSPAAVGSSQNPPVPPAMQLQCSWILYPTVAAKLSRSSANNRCDAGENWPI